MKRLSEYLFLGTLGGTLYYTFEMIFRGFSHWSMFLLGGICLVFFAQQGMWTGWTPLSGKQVGWCVIFVTACEFITGIFVNKINGWAVWDYTGPALSTHGSDLPAFCHYFFRSVRAWHPFSAAISCIFCMGRNCLISMCCKCVSRLPDLLLIQQLLRRYHSKE